MAKHLIILGTGSVGRRHMRNLTALGCAVSGMNPGEERLNMARQEVQMQKEYRKFDDVMAEAALFDGAVIASPPKFHIEQALALLEAGVPVLMEKPLTTDSALAQRFWEGYQRISNHKFLLGYTYRWWPPLLKLKELLQEKPFGRPLHVRFVMSAHLADWHPWENYRSFFMASRELGGGALLDESHFVDLMLWLFGRPSDLQARVEKLSDLDIETDDNVDVMVRYDNGPRVSIHLDLFGRPHERALTIACENGTIVWSWEPNEIRMASSAEGNWEKISFACERNEMFMDVDKEFLEIIDGKAASYPVEDAVDVMKIVDACRQASASGQKVEFKWDC